MSIANPYDGIDDSQGAQDPYGNAYANSQGALPMFSNMPGQATAPPSTPNFSNMPGQATTPYTPGPPNTYQDPNIVNSGTTSPTGQGIFTYQGKQYVPGPGGTYTPYTAPTSAPSGGGGAAGGGIFAPFSGSFSAPTPTALPNVPTFTAPTYTQAPGFSYADFKGPSVADALNDPGYLFRRQQGQNALQNWAAARGTLADSGTAKALEDYGENDASQEYQNVWNRDLNAYQTNRAGAVQQYNTNYQTQYQDPYTASYQAAKDAFAPQMTQYSTQAANVQHNNDLANSNAFNNYYLGWQDYEARRQQGVSLNESF